MITLNKEAEERAKEALQRIDQALTTDTAFQEALRAKAHEFRDLFFEAFGFVEDKSLSLNEVLIKINRIDANQVEVTNKKYPPFLLLLDAEPAYDYRPLPASKEQPAEDKPRWVTELAARLFVVLAPPHQGLLRYYTIFSDGAWKRTTFTLTSSGVQSNSPLVPRFSPDILVLEAIDLLGYAGTIHPTWDNLAAAAETVTSEELRTRSFVKTHLSGLGGPTR
jgi:hypothetical protein